MKKSFIKVVVFVIFAVFIFGHFPLIPVLADSDLVSNSLKYNENNNFKDFNELKIASDTLYIGLGEASHGVSEYQNLKGDFFKHLVENKITKTFAIEGDFAGALFIDEYINGLGSKDESSEEIIGKLGFKIYRTKEMASIIDWMKEYNEGKNKEDKLHIYGFDCQRSDAGKEYIFNTLNKFAKDEVASFKNKLEALNDSSFYNLKSDDVKIYDGIINDLIYFIESNKESIIKNNDELRYINTLQCAKNLKNQLQLKLDGREYGIVRDEKMAENVIFIQELVKEAIYLNGHNGHISYKSNLNYNTLGKILKDKFKEKYIAFGTDARITEFNSFELDKIEIVSVENYNPFIKYIEDKGEVKHFFDFNNIEESALVEKIKEKMSLSSLNVYLDKGLRDIKFMYTINMVPSELYDGIFIYDKVNRSTLLN